MFEGIDYAMRQKLRKMPYPQFICTEFWQAVRLVAIRQAGHRCQICNSPHLLEVHHRTYRHRGYEDCNLQDLTVLCDGCHEKHHSKLPSPTEKKNPLREPTFGGGEVTDCRQMTEMELEAFRKYRAKKGLPVIQPPKIDPEKLAAFNRYWNFVENLQAKNGIVPDDKRWLNSLEED